MRKFSEIEESLWAHVQSQASGDTIKVEDDVDCLDLNSLYDYLKCRYRILTPNGHHKIVSVPSHQEIFVPIIYLKKYSGLVENVYFSMYEETVYCSPTMPFLINGLYSMLNDKFSLKKTTTRYYISPKDGSEVNNSFFIEVIDFIIDNIPDESKAIKNIVNESLWADVQSQASGESIKKEDEYENFDMNRFVDYVDEHYVFTKKNANQFLIKINKNRTNNVFTLMVLKIVDSMGSKYVHLIYTLSDDGYELKVSRCIQETYIYSKLKERYIVFSNPRKTNDFYVTPKDGEVNNKFFIEVLDLLIDYAKGNIENVIEKK